MNKKYKVHSSSTLPPGPKFDWVRNDDHTFHLVEWEGDKPIRIVGSDGGEPEDQNLIRDWAWVADELNAQAARIDSLTSLYNDATASLAQSVQVGERAVAAAEKASAREKLLEERLHEAFRTPTHRCKVCGALWRFHPPDPSFPPDHPFYEGPWSVVSKEFGKCCDNEPMGEQIEDLAGLVAIAREQRDMERKEKEIIQSKRPRE